MGKTKQEIIYEYTGVADPRWQFSINSGIIWDIMEAYATQVKIEKFEKELEQRMPSRKLIMEMALKDSNKKLSGKSGFLSGADWLKSELLFSKKDKE